MPRRPRTPTHPKHSQPQPASHLPTPPCSLSPPRPQWHPPRPIPRPSPPILRPPTPRPRPMHPQMPRRVLCHARRPSLPPRPLRFRPALAAFRPSSPSTIQDLSSRRRKTSRRCTSKNSTNICSICLTLCQTVARARPTSAVPARSAAANIRRSAADSARVRDRALRYRCTPAIRTAIAVRAVSACNGAPQRGAANVTA